jgi:hypothetical protein
MRCGPDRYMYRSAGPCMHGPERGRTCAAPPVGACADWNKEWTTRSDPLPRIEPCSEPGFVSYSPMRQLPVRSIFPSSRPGGCSTEWIRHRQDAVSESSCMTGIGWPLLLRAAAPARAELRAASPRRRRGMDLASQVLGDKLGIGPLAQHATDHTHRVNPSRGAVAAHPVSARSPLLPRCAALARHCRRRNPCHACRRSSRR